MYVHTLEPSLAILEPSLAILEPSLAILEPSLAILEPSLCCLCVDKYSYVPTYVCTSIYLVACMLDPSQREPSL